MPSQLGLVIAAATAPPAPVSLLAPKRGVPYACAAVASPVSLSLAIFAGCVGLGASGVVGAAIAVFAVLGLAATAARSRRVQRFLDEQAESRMRAKREYQRLRLLRTVGSTRQLHYHELRALVEQVERLDKTEAERFELQDLLDHFVRIVVDHRRCGDALRVANGHSLPVNPCDADNKSRRRRDIIQRRMRHRDECTRRMEKLADEIEATDELIRLVAQRVACPDLDAELDRELDRRLWELDEVDAALHQLSA